MKQFPDVVPQVTETSAGPAMITLLITSGGSASRTAAARTLTDVPPLGGLVTVTNPRGLPSSWVKFRITMNWSPWTRGRSAVAPLATTILLKSSARATPAEAKTKRTARDRRNARFMMASPEQQSELKFMRQVRMGVAGQALHLG